MTAIRTFLARAVPWPSATQPGFVNVHWANRDPATNAQRGIAGRAFDNHGKASNFVSGMLSINADLYVCMSLQAYAEDGLNAKGRSIKKALRAFNDALLLRSWWIDIDVKPGTFATTVEAKAAFDKWRILVGLPEPTFIVLSGGGGFHVHWVVDDPVSRETWLPLAHALQNALKTHQFPVDYNVIINPVCLLRIPGTKHFKDPKNVRDVTLDQALNFTYPLSRIEQALEPYKVSYALHVNVASPRTILPFKANPKFAVLGAPPRLDAGIEEWVPTINDVADVCPWIEATLGHGGVGYSEPLWWESVKVAAFCKDGLLAALDLSDGHESFDEAATTQKFEQASGTHGGGRIGWPQCRTINSAGAHECVTCPHFKDDRSPLNYVAPKPTPAQATPAPGAPAATPSPQPAPAAPVVGLRVADHSLPNYGFGPLPPGHLYDTVGIVYAEVEGPDPNNPNRTIMQRLPVLNLPLFDLSNHRKSATGQGFDGVSFICRTDATNDDPVVLKLEDVADNRAVTVACARQNVTVQNPALFRKLMTSYREHLRTIGLSMKNSEGFGWSIEKGHSEPTGFCYGGVRHSAGAPTRYTPIDQQIASMYAVHGDLAYWKAAAALITDQNRADLNAVIASAFAGPLVYWTGHAGMVLSAYSNASGIGKSHAIRIAQSVWANPQAALSALDDTGNYVTHRISVLRHLPFFYDELRQDDDTKKLVNMVFAMGQGKSKGRLSANAEAREVLTFSTLMTITSNTSLMGYINDHVKTTTAGINRIFEMEIARVENAPGLIDTTVAQTINGGLNSNCGVAGEVYARFLGRNIATVKAAVADTSAAVNEVLKASHDERFWVSLIAILLVGAKFANHLGLTNIDERALAGHLLGQFNANRKFRVSSTVDLDTPENAMRYVADYYNARRDGLLYTDSVILRGRPPAGYKPVILNHESQFNRKLVIRRARDQHLMRISLNDFKGWLKHEAKVSQSDQVIAALVKAGAVKAKINVGANTNLQTAREDGLEFDLTKYPNLFD